MTEGEARDWLCARFPTRMDVLERFMAILQDEAGRQNLIARSTLDSGWARHIVDSAQLLLLAPTDGTWLDIGSGGGLPGLVIAILRDAPMILVEPRRKRADFLNEAATSLGLDFVSVRHAKIQSVDNRPSVISARAVAPVHDLLNWTRSNVSRETRYLLPRGKSWAVELEIARHAWHGAFHVEQSLTDPESGIIVAKAVRPR